MYRNPIAKGEEVKARSMLAELFDYYVMYPQKMPEFFYKRTEIESVKRCVCDYVSGMTDRYAIDVYKKIFIPGVWQKVND